MPLTLEDLRPVLDQLPGDGLTVSCYIDLSTNPRLAAPWPKPFKEKVSAIKAMLADDPSAWHQFEQNFEAIGRVLEGPEVRQACGIAVFAARQRDFLKSYPLAEPVENDLVIHETPYLVPLLQTMCRQQEYLVVHTDSHRGRLYAAAPGSLHLLREIERSVPRHQHSSGERWGKEQATIARHREERILHYQKELIDLIAKAWATRPFRGLILLGEHEVVEHLRKRLPPSLAPEVVHKRPHSWPEKPLAIEGEIQSILVGTQQAHEEWLLDHLRERFRENYGVVAGPGDVIKAIEQGQVGPRGHGYLVFGPDPREVVARCTACRTLDVEMHDTCPRCHAPCVEANLQEELLLLALRHELTVHYVKGNQELAQRGGVAAVLARPAQVYQAAVVHA